VNSVWHTTHVVFFGLRYRSPTRVNREVVDINHRSFLMHPLLRGKIACSSELKIFVYKIIAVHFDIIWELVDNMKVVGVPYDRERRLFALDIMFRLCDHVISRQSPHTM
jgi:hypothetical protein